MTEPSLLTSVGVKSIDPAGTPSDWMLGATKVCARAASGAVSRITRQANVAASSRGRMAPPVTCVPSDASTSFLLAPDRCAARVHRRAHPRRQARCQARCHDELWLRNLAPTIQVSRRPTLPVDVVLGGVAAFSELWRQPVSAPPPPARIALPPCRVPSAPRWPSHEVLAGE